MSIDKTPLKERENASASCPNGQSASFADEVALVVRARDRQAFTRLFDYYAPRLKSFLVRGHCSPALAEEITQDVMIVLWQKAHLYDPAKSSLGTWLFRIARNRRVDLLRRDQSMRLNLSDPDLFSSVSVIDEAAMDDAARDQRVRLALTQLPDEQGLLVRLSFFEGKTHAEIEQQLALPLGTVKSRIRLAFNRLRRKLQDEADR